MRIGILALHGAFMEHGEKVSALGMEPYYLRGKDDLAQSFDGLILPGGESTVQMKLLKDTGLFLPLKEMIEGGLPTLGTCAGLILLSSSVEGQNETGFATMPVCVRRNAYGRQLSSFTTFSDFATIGSVPMTFIRAPLIVSCSPPVDVMARVNGEIVAVKYKTQYGLSFHPELGRTEDAEWIYRTVFGV